MNKVLIGVVGAVVGGFVLLMVVGSFATNNYQKDIKHLEQRQNATQQKDDMKEGSIIYGQGVGKEHVIVEGVTLAVHSIQHGKTDGTSGVLIAIKNDRNQTFYLNKRNLYLEDKQKNQYPVYQISNANVEKDVKVDPNSINEYQEGFSTPPNYEGEFIGWNLIYEGSESTVKAKLKVK